MSSGKKSIRSVEKEPVHYILRLDFQSALWTNEKTVNVSSGKRRAEFSIRSSGKRNEMLYTCRLAEEPGFSILSSGKKEMLSSRHVKKQESWKFNLLFGDKEAAARRVS